MVKNEKIIFTKYNQFYEGTFQSADGNRVKVASVTGGIHTVNSNDVFTPEAYTAKRKAEKESVDK